MYEWKQHVQIEVLHCQIILHVANTTPTVYDENLPTKKCRCACCPCTCRVVSVLAVRAHELRVVVPCGGLPHELSAIVPTVSQ